MPLRVTALSWGRVPTLVLALCALSTPVLAQPKGHADKGGASAPATTSDDKKPAKGDKKEAKTKTFDFNALDLNGRMRTPQLLYFLERANEELERASLEKRSFIPHMVKSVDEEQL
jgi:hypothetical protein